MTLQEVVARFNTTPFLFAGSGITRRYYELPDWVGLLTHFADLIKKDEFAFRSYESKVAYATNPVDRLPAVASLIEQDFNSAWFENVEGVRSGSEEVFKYVSNGIMPFKAEICAYIRSLSTINKQYSAEVEKLKNISRNNLSGVITTNYDQFFEDVFDGYKVFVGQDELVFSQLQGVAEIYKIHGSIESPASIVINQEDYRLFRDKGKYLAAKLMTIFMEYPIVFIGYSISDSDIQEILTNVVECLPDDKIETLQKRFVFAEYKPDITGVDVSSHSMTINSKVIEMTKVTLADFGLLYEALSAKKAALPVKLLRRFKDEMYTFALTNEPGPIMRVAPLNDRRIDEDTLALTIGLASTGIYGLAKAVNSEHWYRNIIMHDSPYSCDDLLEYVYPELAKQNSWKLPVWFYIANAEKTNFFAESKAPKQYSEIVTDRTIQRNHSATMGKTALEIWEAEKNNLLKAIRLLGCLPQESIDIEQYQKIIEEIFKDNNSILNTLDGPNRSNLNRMIRIFDFLRYGQKRPRDSSICKQTPSRRHGRSGTPAGQHL